MQLMRSMLLWASRNARMERIVRSSRPMRPLVSRFMPGEDLEAAIVAVRRLQAEGTATILTYLGENVTTDAAADQTVAEYDRLFAALKQTGADAHVSIKLTQLGWDLDRGRALDRVRRLARTAAASGPGMMLAVDMEGSEYVDSTVDAYAQLTREFNNVALCVQAYLHRTPNDLKRLLAPPLKPYIRLVKGAYREPGSIALQGRPQIDERYRALAKELLAGLRHGARAVFGTHDLKLADQIRKDAHDAGVSESQYEIQMLYGIQDAGRRKLANEGLKTRVLISYGKAWYPWFMRRLAEKPANLWLIGRNLLS
ncbi:MAG TPA: proline dehydrogenase family protein [Gemmatimonadaceae bacterium]|nr:proline dehydrogenase family protein [Gemmatimonadaceae bacterium]